MVYYHMQFDLFRTYEDHVMNRQLDITQLVLYSELIEQRTKI